MLPFLVSPAAKGRALFFCLTVLLSIPLTGCFTTQIRELKTQVQMREARIQQLQQDLGVASERADEAEKRVAVLEKEVGEQAALIESLRTDLGMTSDQLSASRLALSTSLDSQSREMANRLQNSIEQIQGLKQRIEELETRASSLDNQLLAAELDEKELREGADRARAELEAARAQVEDLQTRLVERDGQMAALRETQSAEVKRLEGELAAKEAEAEKAGADKETLESETALLKSRIAELEKAEEALRREVEKSAAALAEASTRGSGKAPNGEVARVDAAIRERLATHTNAGSVRIATEGDAVHVILFSDDLFDTGTTLLTDGGLRALKEIDAVIQASPVTGIVIEGHTDNVPVRNMPYPDNWELAAARASEVTRWLAAQPGADAKKIVAQSHAYYDPIGDNSTASGRRLNRRVEVVLHLGAAE